VRCQSNTGRGEGESPLQQKIWGRIVIVALMILVWGILIVVLVEEGVREGRSSPKW